MSHVLHVVAINYEKPYLHEVEYNQRYTAWNNEIKKINDVEKFWSVMFTLDWITNHL